MKLARVLVFHAAMHLASAAPLDGANALQRRDLVVQTKIVNIVETVTSTTTITLKPGEPSPAPKAKPDAQQQRPPAAPAVTTTSSTSSAESKPSPPPPAAAPVVAHQDPKPNTSPPQQQAPKPPKPPVQPPAQPQPKPKAAAPQTPASGSSSGGAGSSKFPVITIPGAKVSNGPGPWKATATHYTVGLGACGWTNTDEELVMAVSHLMMGDQSNGNPLCGRFATITGPNGTPVKAKVVDKCGNCHDDSPTGPFNIDLSPGLFKAVGDGDGVINVTWGWA